MIVYPRQKNSTGEKNLEWVKSNGTYWREQANFDSKMYKELSTLYRAADGDLIEIDYKYILNPLNTEVERFKHFPAQLRNLNILKPVLNAFLGEQLLKPHNIQVICVNDTETNEALDSINEEMYGLWAQDVVNKFNSAGINTGVDSQEIPPMDQAYEQKKRSYRQNRAIFGQEALDYIRHDLKLDDKAQDGLFHWIVSGQVYTRKDVAHDDLDYGICHPVDIWYSLSPESPYIEDANAVVYRRRMNINDVIDRFYDKLTSDQVTQLESRVQGISNIGRNSFTLMKTEMDFNSPEHHFSNSLLSGGLVNVDHIVWKTFKKVGFLTYTNQYGMTSQMEVDDTYKFDKEAGDLNIDWRWVNQVYEVYNINEDIWTEGRPLLIQRNELSNISSCKLPYNGRTSTNQDGSVNSIIKDGLPYQAIYNIMNYQREMTLNRNKDKVMLMPYGMVPSDLGDDPHEAFSYYMGATGIAWYDETKPNTSAVLQAIKGIDLGLGQYVEQMTNLLKSVREEYWDAVGMNRQRYGQTMASDGKGVNEQALLRSSVITAEYFRKFDKLMETDYNGLLDYSKAAWINGKKGMFINSDGRKKFFELDAAKAPDHLESEYGVFVIDNSKEDAKLQFFREIGKTFAQDPNIPKSMVAEMGTGNNVAKIRDYIDQAEQLTISRLSQEKKDANDTQKYVADKGLETQQAKGEIEIQKANINKEAVIQASLIRANADVLGYDTGLNGENDVNIIAQAQADRESGLDERKFSHQQTVDNQKIRQGDEKIKSAERIAKMNKNKYDKK